VRIQRSIQRSNGSISLVHLGELRAKHNKPQVLGEYNFRSTGGGYRWASDCSKGSLYPGPWQPPHALHRAILKALRIRLEPV